MVDCKLPLKRLALSLGAMLALGAGVANAEPSLQSCAPMEVTHSGTIGLSYSMACTAGGWQLRYTGAVPAGADEVNVQYQLQVRGADGASFNQQRTLTLPSPAHLGQMLAREAVLLDGGDIALRECKEPYCTLYRPLGHQKGLSKATVTVPPEVQKLRLEREQLATQLAEKGALVAAQAHQLEQLTAELTQAKQSVLMLEAQAKAPEVPQPIATQERDQAAAFDALSVSFDTVMAERNQLKKELGAANAAHAETSEKLALALAEQSRLSEAMTAAQAHQVSTQTELEALQQNLAALEASNQALEAELAAVKASSARQAQLDQAASASDNANAVGTVRAELQQAEQRIADSQKAAIEKDAEIQALKAQLSTLEAEHNTQLADQGAPWKNTISVLLDERHAAREQARQAEHALHASQAREAQLQAELNALKHKQHH